LLSAPAQGALAVECRRDDAELVDLLGALDDPSTRAAVLAERALLAELEAGCTAPVGALAEVVESLDEDGRVFDEISLRGCAAAADGSDVLRASGVGPLTDPEGLGRAVARELIDLGAHELMGVRTDAARSENGGAT
jgi:hydroxymethylbilane synthase